MPYTTPGDKNRLCVPQAPSGPTMNLRNEATNLNYCNTKLNHFTRREFVQFGPLIVEISGNGKVRSPYVSLLDPIFQLIDIIDLFGVIGPAVLYRSSVFHLPHWLELIQE